MHIRYRVTRNVLGFRCTSQCLIEASDADVIASTRIAFGQHGFLSPGGTFELPVGLGLCLVASVSP